MSAIEMMDPKMDAGMTCNRASSAPVSWQDCVDSGELVLHPDGRKKQIEHMMDAYWWSFITMTTVNHL